jgi:nitrogen fixation NifU-like protein
MDLYREHILDHARSPRGWGRLAVPDATAQMHNPLCGDTITIELTCTQGTITAMRWEASGCAISRAAASLLAEALPNTAAAEVRTWGRSQIESLLQTPLLPARLNCGLLALQAVQKAVKEYGDYARD